MLRQVLVPTSRWQEVLNRSLFLGGRYPEAFEELVAAREAAGETHLKTILGVGELDQVPLHETLEEGWMSPERFDIGPRRC